MNFSSLPIVLTFPIRSEHEEADLFARETTWQGVIPKGNQPRFLPRITTTGVTMFRYEVTLKVINLGSYQKLPQLGLPCSDKESPRRESTSFFVGNYHNWGYHVSTWSYCVAEGPPSWLIVAPCLEDHLQWTCFQIWFVWLRQVLLRPHGGRQRFLRKTLNGWLRFQNKESLNEMIIQIILGDLDDTVSAVDPRKFSCLSLLQEPLI